MFLLEFSTVIYQYGNNHCLNKCTFPLFLDAVQIENLLTNVTCGCKNSCCNSIESCNNLVNELPCGNNLKLPSKSCMCNNFNNFIANKRCDTLVPTDNISKTIDDVNTVRIFNRTNI